MRNIIVVMKKNKYHNSMSVYTVNTEIVTSGTKRSPGTLCIHCCRYISSDTSDPIPIHGERDACVDARERTEQ